MKKIDELTLIMFLRLHLICGLSLNSKLIRRTVSNVGMAPKRAEYVFYKWTDKGQWEFGTSVFGGWFTEKGLDELVQIKND